MHTRFVNSGADAKRSNTLQPPLQVIDFQSFISDFGSRGKTLFGP
jgi:hypothetical protein